MKQKAKPTPDRLGGYLTAVVSVGTLAGTADAAIVNLDVSSITGVNAGLTPGAGVTADADPSEWPAPMPGTYWPPDLAAELNDRRILPADIHGDIISLFVPDGPKVDQQRDRRLQRLAEKLAEAYSVQAAACHLMQSDPEWDFMAVYFRAIDEICHMFMHYHPPKMAGIPEDDFQMYQQVVTGAYRAHDMMLRRLIHLAGPDTAVMLVSDHGFHSDHLRPKFTPRVPADITVWHRPQGVFLVKGPGFKADALIHGARLLDIAPTILHHFGLPVGADMEGRVLTECFAGNRPVETIPTWETAAKNPQARGSLTEEESKALLDQFVALGYIDEVSADPTEAADETNRENQWNLARACLYGGKYDLALPLLEDCFTAYPALRKWDEAKVTAERMLELDPGSAEAHLILARHFLHHRQPDEAAAAALEATGLDFANPRGHLLLGIALSQQENWSAAAHALRNHLQLNPQNGRAYRHLAHACRNLGETEQADEYETRSRVLRTKNLTEATRRISALLPHLPPKHRYKILFMRRPVEQVVDSQWKMLENQGMFPKSEKAHLIATQETHVSQLLATLRQSPRIELLEVDFPALVADPLAVLPKIREFLGDALTGELETLAAVVKPELLHHRAPIPEQA